MCVCVSLSLPCSMSGITASTVNYLWSVQDVLGQGATASVYKARNKVATHTGGTEGKYERLIQILLYMCISV